MPAAQQTWAQAWSEPNSGSDLASVRAHAVRDEEQGGWRLYGQKTWSTRAAFCDMAYGLFRTDPNETRHRGLTYFLFSLVGDGVEVRAVERLDGDEGFAERFLDGLFVADGDILGEVDRGWYVAMSTTSSERGLSLRSPGRFMATADRLIALYRAAWSLDRGASALDVHLAMAKVMASEAAETVIKAALQVHGAIGYSTEFDLHLYMKCACALARAHGSASDHRQFLIQRIVHGAQS